ncbi:hypothetical protein EJ110_NYTH29575 [Nymphaea thermarum]|nr:hypothetical protein EJ110_NYTH29575 [Nymphaea thermarum]
MDQIKFEEGVIGTPQLTDSIVLPESVEFLGQNIDLSPLKGLMASVQNAASSVAKTISDQPPLKFPITSERAQSWLLTTYLDHELRISRGDGSSIFVLVKEAKGDAFFTLKRSKMQQSPRWFLRFTHSDRTTASSTPVNDNFSNDSPVNDDFFDD